MAIFSLAAVGCTGLGAVVAGWVDMNKHMGWRWIQWLHLMYVPPSSHPPSPSNIVRVPRVGAFPHSHPRRGAPNGVTHQR